MKTWIAAALAALITLPVHAADAGAVRVEPIAFTTSADSVQRKQSIKGDQTAEYKLNAKAGQMLTVDFKPSNTSAYFNITAKGADYALFNGSIMGNHFLGTLPSDGEYTVQVYLMRNAARRNEVANYDLSLRLVNGDTTLQKPFDQTLELQGIAFHVSTEQVGDKPTLRIVPKGLEIDNTVIIQALSGDVVRAEVADLNNDGSPELYVFTRSPGRGMPGELIAYSANNKKSLSEIYLPPVSDNPKTAEGYQGEDSFAVVENTLVQRFPVYDSADAGAGRTGKMRQVQYKLVAGEAGWILREDKVTEF
ncbi:PliI family lysozyme inhibitor of I-type lysozyme [Pseudomonas sp. MG-9]|uniref:PliI family lysozyme inhibitor of I-type lysozyme n=1 Tax=Pseudomonas sp. MG-9 TaxID=2839032 RepID=UPI001C003D52|nr:PliI family lysozyme inhibitor of I-type lysozyme [Pseudomonas sp. MG-9]MBT9266844.1 PliI family lysozyme inhibitor of I-type lysozyme [Pseudomonas sp. MG-9]